MGEQANSGATTTPWQGLKTEQRHAASHDLDEMSEQDVVSLLLREDRAGLEATQRCSSELAQAASWFAETLNNGGDVVFIGAGTSGRLGVIEAAECPPTFSTDPRRIRAIMAGGEEAVFRAVEGAEDGYPQGAEAVADLGSRDLLIGLSASSVTPFVRGALDSARQQVWRTVLLTCVASEGLAEAADLVLALDTGPEILAGSTRLKAGSATKAALNAITTTAMVRSGKVFENLMVDLKPGSAKLRHRAVGIVQAAVGGSRSEAANLYEAAGEVKVAIVMGRLGVTAAVARQRLLSAAGSLRRAIELH